MGTEMLIPNNRERTIDALARNNSIIKSLFHFEKKITFLIVSLAIQKIKANLHIGGLVIITKLEIQDLKTGNDAKVGINKLIELIRKDLEIHNFFNLYSPNSGLKDIRQGLIQKTALTKDLFNDLVIHFDENMFKVFKSEKNYTIQSLNQLVNCKENQIIVLYALTQPYAKPNSPYLKLNVLELRLYLRIADDSYTMPRTLTLRVKKICQKITNTTDINLTVIPIKKNGTTGVTIGYQFRSEFKNQKTITKIEDVKIIDSNAQTGITWWNWTDNHIPHVVLIGQSAKELGNNIHTAKVTYANSMEAAVNVASTLIDKGAILLSPACASFDMFDDFEQRGRVFKDCVNNWGV